MGIRVLLLVSLLAAIQPAIVLGQSDSPLGAWIGSWTLISAQSSLDPPNRLSITAVHGGIHVVMSGETHFDFTASSNGHASPAPGNFGFNQITLHRVDKREADVTEKKDGAAVAKVREQLSTDGNELTSTTTARGKPAQITVWKRSGGAKLASDRFAGDWVEDLTQTRLRQGLAIRISASGSGAIHFEGDFSYTARFDGKQYDLVNSRNDTVMLQLADSHTIDATYWRGNQIAQKDQWRVSSDGRQMTLTTAATLETGQRLAEKLAFRKQ